MALPIHSWQGPGISWKSDATRFVIADESGYKTHCSPRMCLLFTVTFDTKLHWLFFPEWLFKWCLFIKIWDFFLLGTFGEVFVCVRELRQLWQNWQLPFKCQMSLPNCNLHLKQKKTIQDTDIPCRHLCYSCGPPRAVVVFFFFFDTWDPMINHRILPPVSGLAISCVLRHVPGTFSPPLYRMHFNLKQQLSLCNCNHQPDDVWWRMARMP